MQELNQDHNLSEQAQPGNRHCTLFPQLPGDSPVLRVGLVQEVRLHPPSWQAKCGVKGRASCTSASSEEWGPQPQQPLSTVRRNLLRQRRDWREPAGIADCCLQPQCFLFPGGGS